MSEAAAIDVPDDAGEVVEDGLEHAKRIEYRPVRQIPTADVNPKAHDLPRIRQSIEKFGFTQSLLWDERTGKITAGHGRLAVVTQMEKDGVDRPKGILASDYGEWLIPVQRGWRSRNDAEASAYLLADNRLTERGGWHERQLAELVREIQRKDEELLHDAGYDDRDTRRILAVLNTVPPTAPTDFPDLTPDEQFAHTCPRCGFGFNDK